MSVNRLILKGVLVSDAEQGTAADGTTATILRVATGERVKHHGAHEDLWEQVVVPGASPATGMRKGATVHIEGRVRTLRWTEGDAEHVCAEIVAAKVRRC